MGGFTCSKGIRSRQEFSEIGFAIGLQLDVVLFNPQLLYIQKHYILVFNFFEVRENLKNLLLLVF